MSSFSIIIPTRNRPVFLTEAVASVLAQDFQQFELLIVNDGDIKIADFEDKRIRILDNQMRGAVPARNLGVSETKGDYIAFLDDDDFFIDRNHLNNANVALGKSADFYFANGTMCFPDGSKKPFSHSADKQSLMTDNTILISTVCYKRSLHDQLGMFDEALPYYWDWDWYLRIANADFRIEHCDYSAVAIRVHPQNMSGNNNIEVRQSNLDLLVAKHRMGKITLKNHIDFV